APRLVAVTFRPRRARDFSVLLAERSCHGSEALRKSPKRARSWVAAGVLLVAACHRKPSPSASATPSSSAVTSAPSAPLFPEPAPSSATARAFYGQHFSKRPMPRD